MFTRSGSQDCRLHLQALLRAYPRWNRGDRGRTAHQWRNREFDGRGFTTFAGCNDLHAHLVERPISDSRQIFAEFVFELFF